MKLQRWIHDVKSKDLKAKYVIRTTVMPDLSVRVRIELAEQMGESAPGVDELFVGPFKSEDEADKEGRNIAKLVRAALGLEKQ